MNSKHNNIVDFDAFVKRQQAGSSEDEGVDWEKERDESLGYLKELYRQTESFLEEYTKTGQIKLTYRKIETNEENIGSYNADQAILKIGRQEITMTPVGTLIIGAKGRVEVVGSAGERASFWLIAKRPVRGLKLTLVSVESPSRWHENARQGKSSGHGKSRRAHPPYGTLS